MIPFGVVFDRDRAKVSGGAERVSRGDGSWLAGDVRLDGRGGKLACLQAYSKWGNDFLDHLSGDFSFALWDEPARRLVCARDRLGVRPLFFAQAGRAWLVSNSLTWIAAQPGVDRELDEIWIGDFLAIGHCRDFERTVYRHVNRLPPAHSLVLSSRDVSARRFWQLQIGDPLRHPHPNACVEEFAELLALSVADRLPAGRVGLAMSSGLDSGTLAACAVEALGDGARVAAETCVFDRLVPDDEEHRSTLVARHLGIDLRLRPMDDLIYDPDWRTRGIRTPEPTTTLLSAHPRRLIAQERAQRAGVWLNGDGPDSALAFEGKAYLAWLRERRGLGPYLAALARHGRNGGIGEWIGTTARRLGRRPSAPSYRPLTPAWVRPEFLSPAPRLEDEPSSHPWRPQAFASFTGPAWQSLLDGFDEGSGPEWRHPYLDLRVLEFMLTVPSIPWTRRKHLLRAAMRDRLPPDALARSESSSVRSAMRQAVAEHGLTALSGSALLDRYVDLDRLPKELPSAHELDAVLRVHALDHWLCEERYV